MASSFKGVNLFGSGPHRFREEPQGQLVVSVMSLGTPTSGSVGLGQLERRVVVKGRLVSTTESGLRSLRDALAAQALSPWSNGTLVDQHGATWSQMWLTKVVWDDRTDRGRARSVGYEAYFQEIAGADA